MLGDITLRSADLFDDILDAAFPVTQHAQDLETQWMRHRLHRARGSFDILIASDQNRYRGIVRAGWVPLQTDPLITRHTSGYFAEI